MLRWMLDLVAEYYTDPLPIFMEEKEPENFFSYRRFEVKNFRGLEDVAIDFSKNELILLLGLNESGKTSILKAIEAFDFNNDPLPENLKSFFSSMRNKQAIESNTPCTITAEISFTEELDYNFFKKVLKAAEFDSSVRGQVENFLESLNTTKRVSIRRVVPFSDGKPTKSYYEFVGGEPLSPQRLNRIMAQEIIRRSPFILYFEDFQDAIPERIHTSRRSDSYNHPWYEIIDGLFYNTDHKYSIKKFEAYYSKTNPREDDARTVLKKVNKTLQKTFTEKWENLSGVQEIEEAEIAYNPTKKYFEVKITEKDGTTYSVHERSKGAIWYLAFLMKTEFRRKKLREGSGKPIYLIDEPASNLHSTAQQKMVQDFFTLVEDTSLIYTTHSRYLISPSNVKSTYVVSRDKGIVRCTRWSDYIKGKDAKVSYYQPLFDCLNVVPNSFDIPWDKAIITEGPADALILEMMSSALGESNTHSIYPGTTASDLKDLISLNLGWGASFHVLLDSDDEGIAQRKKYLKLFELDDDRVILLPKPGSEIEDMFSNAEKIALYELAFGGVVDTVSKKELLAVVRAIMASNKKLGRVATLLDPSTLEMFRHLFAKLKAD
jgi:predicted ATP-dependent endonuclease of OLD family